MKKLLIVDDEPSLRELYRAAFSFEGYDVVLATDGPEAIEMASKENPNLVIMDIRMPGMNGLETMAQLLSIDNELPVILNSAYSHYRETFQAWSADGYVEKSSDLSPLMEKVGELLEAQA